MASTICIAASTLYYPKGGGHMWVYLNWALGFIENGCRVIWLEEVKKYIDAAKNKEFISCLKKRLAGYNLQNNVALWQSDGVPFTQENPYECLDVETAANQSDIFLNLDYFMPASVVRLFRVTALLDIDPGLLQMWITKQKVNIIPHDYYFTIGETVGRKNSLIPGCGLPWVYTPPCVSLYHWPVASNSKASSFTTVSHWSGNGWEEDQGRPYDNDKREGFLPYLELPKYSPMPLELAVLLGDDEEEEERSLLEKKGWRVLDSHNVTSTPADYQAYIQQSLGEFSCVKPSCIRLQNAWISDRTICYLASGKPAIIQHTGTSRFLPDSAGLLCFRNFNEAIKCLEEAVINYDRHSRFARALAEEYFDAKKVTKSLLERTL